MTSDNMQTRPFTPCAVIPVYNHWLKLRYVVEKLSAHQLHIVLVDDGSNQTCRDVIQELVRDYSNIYLVTRQSNGGKGAAIKDGLLAAQQLQFTHALQVDADGQHNLEDVASFISIAQANPGTLIAGYPEYDDTVPKVRYYFRYLTHICIHINTLSTRIKDSMCGFRVYPVDRSCDLIRNTKMGDRMDFDCEFMVRWSWAGFPIKQTGTRVTYPEDGVSHFKLLQDNGLIALMHVKLFVLMLTRIPTILSRNKAVKP